MSTTRDELRALIEEAQDSPVEPMEIPEWGGTFYLRTLGGDERDDYENWLAGRGVGRGNGNSRDLVGLRAKWASLCLGDSNGERLFGDDEISILAAKNGMVLERIRAEGMRFNGYSSSEVDEMVGNSSGGTNADSGFVSPDTSDAPSESANVA